MAEAKSKSTDRDSGDLIHRDAVRRELIEQVTELYRQQKEIAPRVSLAGIAEQLNTTPVKVRKMLITAGVYENSASREILALWEAGKSVREIHERTGWSVSSIHSYLPYTKLSRDAIAQRQMEQLSEELELSEGLQLPQRRAKAVERLKREFWSLQRDPAWERVPEIFDHLLWETVVLFENYPFSTAKNLTFTYSIRGHEMFVSRKDKSITRATILVTFHKAMELQRGGNEIIGPKKLGTFGASYLFPIFLRLGVIAVKGDEQGD